MEELEVAPETPLKLDSSTACRIQVSSRHLVLASSVFKLMLEGPFQEAQDLLLHGKAELILPEDYADALLILLRLIHGQVEQVNHELSFRTFAELAVLVDKYALHNVTSILLDVWYQRVTHLQYRRVNSDLIRWICISWLLKKEAEFSKYTQMFINHSTHEIYDKSLLLIPDVILG